ncbi:hypothetical protein TPHA_0N01620 [Tetrapisispora phaffii CBS 4417]|uniref:Mitochondrial outer membrane transport complex Sam37/metaxin N-terminal domain-containing protein n=1 Tax=Tetrapisispora phaffii (strain ATCC 24235 / CBS 4417 / NBRC 1672 / NRRL Y-8282 / UCD 70-5) TaxID=1071381 RepID=G8C1B5_TETPH|nr:hypothetical protein TPHA_0N01620 [Tetrapisispora phaffii CBS 4417]CCE65943.1 hypothetical protein TPHA_0N01620 [Tetrapisispora phaffii CBS 4417]
MYEFHLWGSGNRASVLSAESIALQWLLCHYLNDTDIEFTIVYSNNADNSPTRELPLMVDLSSGQKTASYRDISKRLVSLRGGNEKQTLLQEALLQYVISDVNKLTEYQLYVNKRNFEELTRNLYSQLLYWPLWNIVPSQKRNEVMLRIENWIGDVPDGNGEISTYEDVTIEEVDAKQSEAVENMAQSKTFAIKNAAARKQREELQNIKHNATFLYRVNAVYKKYTEISSQLKNSDSMHTSVVKLLFLANVFIWSQLPNYKEIKTHLLKDVDVDKNEYEKLFDKIESLNSGTKSGITIRKPYFKEQCNIIMTLYNYIASYI